MKLRINTKLRAALIAAITTVGFTITQAQAWQGGPEDDYGGRGHLYYTDSGQSGVSLTDTSRDTFWITSNAKSTTASIASVTAKDGALVHISGTNSWHNDYALTLLTIQSIHAASDSGTITISTQPYSNGASPSSTNVNIQSVGGTLGGVDNYGVMTLGSTGTTIHAAGALVNQNGASLTLNGAFVFDVADASRYAVKSAGEESWSDAANKQGFKTSTGASYYVIQGATEGSNLSVTSQDGQPTIENSGGDYYFTSTGTVTDYSKFYVNADTATLNENLSGQLIINQANATVTVDKATFSGTITGDNKANLIVKNGGTLVLTGQTAFGSTDNTFTICEGSTVDLNGKADGNYSYTLAGGTITNSGNAIGGTSSQTVGLILTADSTVNADSGHDFRLLARGYDPTSLNLNSKTLVKTGDGLFALKNTTVTAGTIKVQGGEVNFEVDPNKGGSTAANITFDGGNVTGTMMLSGDITLTAMQTVATGVAINAQNHALALAGDANLTLTGSVTNVSGITKTGTGTATINASGSLNKSIDVQAGSLVLGGTFAIDDIALDPDSTVIYYDSTGAQNTSGFRNVAGAKSAYTVAQDASITATGATFTVGGKAVQLNEQGKYLIAGSTDYTTVWANKGDTVDYAAYVTAAQTQQATISSVRVADGGNVNLNGGTVANLRFDTDGAVAGIEGIGTISSLTGAGTLDLHAGAQAAMAGTVSVNTGNSLNTTGEGSMTVETLKVDGGTVNIASNLTVTGGGNGKGSTNNNKGLFLTGSGSTVNINGGTTTVTGAVYTNGSGVAINVGTGDAEATLVAGRIELGDNGGGTGSFTIGANGKVVVTGNEDYRNDTANPQKNTSLQMAEWGQQMTDTIRGKLYAQGATAFMSNDADSTINIDGGTMAVKGIVCSNVTANRAHNISLTNNGKLVLGERGIADESGNWNINLASGEIGMTADTTLGRDMTVTGDVTFNTAKYTWEGSGASLELKEGTEGGTMTVSGTISGSGNITKKGAGTLVIDTMNVTGGSFGLTEGDATIGYVSKTGEGAYTMSSTGTTSLVYGIDLQGGTLTMSGNYDISDIYVESGDPTYEGGEHDGNGFAVVEGTASVVSVEEGAKLDTDGATFTWNDKVVTVESDGTAAVEGTNYGTFYVNTASETVTKAKSMEHEHGALSAIYVADEGTLTVDQDIDASLLHEYSTGTVSINEGKTVADATGDRYFTLAGSGTYGLGSGVSSMGGVALGDDWAGTVRISNVTKNNIDLAPFVNGTLSTVELKGFSGWTGNNLWKGLNPQNIKLTDTEDGGVAWYSNAYSSSKTDTAVYSGKWSGDGTYVTDVNAARYLNHTYSGDIADWTGVFEKRGDGTSILTFIDNAEEVNVEIKRTAGTLNLVVGNGSDPFDAVFHEEVSVTSVEVKANASATFLESTTATTVTNAGTVMFNTLEGLTQAITNTGDVIFNSDFEVAGFQETSGESGYFDLNEQFSTDGNGYAGTSDSYLTIVSGGTVVADNIVVTQDGEDYTMNNSGLALKGDGEVTDWTTFHVNTGTVNISDVKADNHANYIDVTGGTLNVDQAGTGISITVTDTGTLTGDELNVQEVGIAQYATASFAQGIHDDRGVEITSDEGTVDVTNIGSFTQAYTLEGEEMVVTAQSIVRTTDEEDITVSNWLIVEDITNVKSGKLTLEGQGEVMTVNNITVGLNSTVEILYQEGNKETTVTVTETLTAGNSTLLANLVMADDSALLVGGVEKALHVGSTLTMGTNIALDGLTLQALDDLAIGDTFWLIDAAEGRELVYMGESGDDAWYDGVFSRIAYGDDSDYVLQGDFNIAFSETDGFGLKKFSNTPEPTTGTLSLLALCALAARRHRKHN